MKSSMHRRDRAHARLRRVASTFAGLLVLTAVFAVGIPAAGGAGGTSDLWVSLAGKSSDLGAGAEPNVRPDRFRAYSLDHGGMAELLADAPRESTRGAAADAVVVSIPAPGGGFERFALEESPVMEPALARKHPEISTYRGRGIDDAGASIRADLSPVGFHASVRSSRGAWYVDPYNHRDTSVYVTYFARDLDENPHGPFIEREDTVSELESLETEVELGPSVGPQLRTYRTALLTDPTYANFHGAANVTAAKVTLMNRVTQIYEDETSIRLVLIGNNDLLNLNTEAQMSGPDGPCGETPCFTPALSTSCAGATLNRNRIVIGQIVGASAFDIGHIALGNPGGGVAGLNVVGGDGKARGCTGLSVPTGDYFAVDYVAHEMGHQFGGNHTFNGTQSNCGGNKAAPSVEPGSGSSIMAYAGICRQDDLQAHSDPYWSQWSFQEITAFVTSSRPAINEVQTVSLNDFSGGPNELQTVALSGFGGTDSFRLRWNGSDSVPIVRGTNYNSAGIKAAIEAIPGFPAGGTVTVTGPSGTGEPTDAGFNVTFGGTLANTDVSPLMVVNPVGATGTVTEVFNGGPTNDSFTLTWDGSTSAPIVHNVGYTAAGIQSALQGASEVQTVALTGYDADGDSFRLSYGGNQSVPIVRGQNNTTAGILAAIQGGNEQQQVSLSGFNASSQSFQIQIGGQTSAVLGAGGLPVTNANIASAVNGIPGFAGTVSSSGAGNTGFTLTFGGASSETDVPSVSIVNCTAPCVSTVREIVKGTSGIAGWPSDATVAVSSLTDGGFTLTFSGTLQGMDVTPFSVVAGTGGTAGTVTETVKGSPGILPPGATAAVAAWGGTGALNDAGFQVTFGGVLAGTNVGQLALTNLTGLTAFVGETAKGGPVDNNGFTITPTGNAAPVVTAPAAYTIPTRTPFALTGSGTDPNGDPLTYMWEQSDRGGPSGTALVNPNKVDGPLFRQFGRAQDASVYNPAAYNSPGENHPTAADRTRVFPDLLQILANNTNAETGDCIQGPPVPPPPTSSGSNVPPQKVECYSEFLPTSVYVGFTGDRTMHFRLTARDGRGGVASQETDTALTIDPAAGPFLVTSHGASATLAGLSSQAVTWDVAGTSAAPIGAANVRITFSTDGGLTYPHVLAASTPNDGSETVTLPNAPTSQGRIRIEAVGNVFFDVSNADLTVQAVAVLAESAESASIEYSDAFSPGLTVTATDPDTPGSGLTATATGLPAGFSLAVASTSSGSTVPGTRTWAVVGNAAGPPGTFAVTVNVTDDQGHVSTTSFTIRVVRADARVTYTGDNRVVVRASSAPVRLSANVLDAAAAPGTPDNQPGDIRKATVTFMEGGTVLCGPLPVQPSNAENTAGTAGCSVSLARGEHRITVVLGDHYEGTTTAQVAVRQLVSCAVAVSPGRVYALRRTRVQAAVRLSGARYAGAQVRFRAPGLNRTVRTNRSGVAAAVVTARRPGTLRVTVRADGNTLGCGATRRVVRASGIAGAATGGAALTGRVLL